MKKRKKPRPKLTDYVFLSPTECFDLYKIVEMKNNLNYGYEFRIIDKSSGKTYWKLILKLGVRPDSKVMFRGKLYPLNDDTAAIINSIIEYKNTLKYLNKL